MVLCTCAAVSSMVTGEHTPPATKPALMLPAMRVRNNRRMWYAPTLPAGISQELVACAGTCSVDTLYHAVQKLPIRP